MFYKGTKYMNNIEKTEELDYLEVNDAIVCNGDIVLNGSVTCSLGTTPAFFFNESQTVFDGGMRFLNSSVTSTNIGLHYSPIQPVNYPWNVLGTLYLTTVPAVGGGTVNVLGIC